MTLEVETASLASTVRQMDAELENILTAKQKLYAALEALDGMWTGAAHDTFASQYSQDQQILTGMIRTIMSVIEGMEDARAEYERCEQSVETEIRKIAV